LPFHSRRPRYRALRRGLANIPGQSCGKPGFQNLKLRSCCAT